MSLSNGITTIFPLEAPSTYYLPYGDSGKTTATGKLYQQYTQYRKTLASRQVITVRKRKTKSKESIEPPVKQLDIGSSESLALALLRTAIDINEHRVLDAWKCTKGYRMKTLNNKNIPTSELIMEFPILSQSNSYKLVSLKNIAKLLFLKDIYKTLPNL